MTLAEKLKETRDVEDVRVDHNGVVGKVVKHWQTNNITRVLVRREDDGKTFQTNARSLTVLDLT